MSLYESYVGIPLPWLSQMPSHWELLRNKNFLQESKKSVGVDSSDYALLSLTKQGIIPRDVASGKGKFPKDFDTYKIVTSGDLVFCLFDIDETPRTVGLSEHDGMLTGAYTVFKLREINPRFINYYYLALDNVKALRPLYSGLRKTIKTNIFLGTKLAVPPRSEQDQIVRYLDWQVSKTNKLISALKKQITLLKEQKQVIINEAVTKGLDPSVPMKDSGVEWIEETPDGWDVMPLKRLFAFGKGLPIKKTDLKEDGASVISYGQVHSKTNSGVDINDTLIRYVDPGYLKTNPQSLVEKGGFIFADTSEDFAGVGNCVFVDNSDKLFAGYHTIILHAFEIEFSEYMAYLFLTDSWRSQLRSRVNGVKVYSVTKSILKQCTVLIPPLQIQKKIINYLKVQCGNIDSLVEKINKEISLLGEYRTRLISDVVTGQIDVRDAVVPEFEYVLDETGDFSDDENADTEEPEGEEA